MKMFLVIYLLIFLFKYKARTKVWL